LRQELPGQREGGGLVQGHCSSSSGGKRSLMSGRPD
jgi:hypothetical protein